MQIKKKTLNNGNTLTEPSKVTTLKKNHLIRGKDVIIYLKKKPLFDHFIITGSLRLFFP